MEIPTTWSTVYTSPWGDITLAARDQGPQGVLVGAWFKGQAHALSTLRGPLVPAPDHPVLRDAVTWLERYVAGERPRPAQLPLLAEGTAFRQLVWSLLEKIPYGTTLTYRELARQAAARLGRPTMSAQAVGGAVGHNPLSVIVPCHRVVASDGSLTGYAGGVWRKAALLAHEGVILP